MNQDNFNRHTFRGQTRRRDDRWYYGWVYGSLVLNEEMTPYEISEFDPEKGGWNQVSIDPATVGQCTGFKDRDGAWIFEGDVVRLTYWWFNGGEQGSILTGEVAYQPEELSYVLRGIKNKDHMLPVGEDGEDGATIAFGALYFEESDLAVIGNVHDSPELLEGD
jgi:uncharacterized phage protein (TIGR01671 family)